MQTSPMCSSGLHMKDRRAIVFTPFQKVGRTSACLASRYRIFYSPGKQQRWFSFWAPTSWDLFIYEVPLEYILKEYDGSAELQVNFPIGISEP